MADSWNAVGSAIYARLAPHLGSALYDGVAPPTITPPYTVWQVLDTGDTRSFGDRGTATFEDLQVMVRVVSDRYFPDQARTIYGTAHTYMEHAPLNVTGYSVMRCERTGGRFQFQDVDKFWNVGAVYTITLQRA